jgi:hypothetical protein
LPIPRTKVLAQKLSIYKAWGGMLYFLLELTCNPHYPLLYVPP